MKVYDCEQGSQEWIDLRLGIPTASRFDCILQPVKMDLSKQCKKYAYELVAERITGESVDAWKSKYMDRGSGLESQAASWHEFETGFDVQPGGFVTSDDGRVGCSTDGMIGADGIREIKCCSAHVHVKNVCGMVHEYKLQIQGCLWITEREWCDLVAYNPVIEPKIVRVERDEKCIEAIAEAIHEFYIIYDEIYKSVTKGVI